MKILKPTRGLHDGSSFREMLDIWKENGWCEVIDNTTPGPRWGDETCWLESRPFVNEVGYILLYDNPILDKLQNPDLTYKYAIFCNEVKKDVNCSSWTFWPNHPKIHEEVRSEGTKGYDQREKSSCFIGSFTTGYRQNFNEYRPYIETFWMGNINQRLLPQKDYLRLLGSHKFGLCLRGIGPKCLRDIELIGLGTVPIFTPGVSTDYYNPLIKDRHFLYAEKPSDIPEVIGNCNKDKWEYMSNECLNWFNENASPRGCFELTQKIVNDYENTL